MKKIFSSLLIACVLAPASAALAADYEGAFRVGYILPSGEALKDADYTDELSGGVQLQLDGLYKSGIGKFGIYFGFSPMLKSDKNKSDHGVYDVTFGLQANMATEQGLWAGVFGGMEQLLIMKDGGDSESFSGLQYGVQAGYEVSNDNISFGPYLSLAFSTYSSVSVTLNGQDRSVDIPSEAQAMHQFFTMGVRGSFKK